MEVAAAYCGAEAWDQLNQERLLGACLHLKEALQLGHLVDFEPTGHFAHFCLYRAI